MSQPRDELNPTNSKPPLISDVEDPVEDKYEHLFACRRGDFNP